MRNNVIITDRMQRGYVYWRTEPVGRNFAPGFTPDLTPKEMLRLGVFGGKYMTDCQEEFPRSWFARARLCAERHDARLNCFGVNASQSLAVWRRSGWIRKQDPTWVVPVVLPLLHGPQNRRRRPADSTLAGDRAARGGDSEALRSGRSRMSEAPAAGRPSLGIRQPEAIGRV